MKTKNGFTLVEILIVVVILGILAAVVIPQFTNAGGEARISSLLCNLQRIRTQLQLYKSQHNDLLPAMTGETPADFERRMLNQTDVDGNAGTQFGPYVMRIPVNAFNNRNTVRIDGAPAGAGTDGWRLDTTSGAFHADDSIAHAGL